MYKTFSIPRPSNIYPNLDFCFENISSGNPFRREIPGNCTTAALRSIRSWKKWQIGRISRFHIDRICIKTLHNQGDQIGWIFAGLEIFASLGSLLSAEVAEMCGLLFPKYKFCINFDKKMGWAGTLWTIFSQSHLVTLTLISLKRSGRERR
jgi:hypothetical protein